MLYNLRPKCTTFYKLRDRHASVGRDSSVEREKFLWDLINRSVLIFLVYTPMDVNGMSAPHPDSMSFSGLSKSPDFVVVGLCVLSVLLVLAVAMRIESDRRNSEDEVAELKRQLVENDRSLSALRAQNNLLQASDHFHRSALDQVAYSPRGPWAPLGRNRPNSMQQQQTASSTDDRNSVITKKLSQMMDNDTSLQRQNAQ